jgi:ribonucleoside-diphosphate reductase alpha chain
LQYGVPLPVLVDKFSHMRFEPSGMTKNPQVRFAKSIVDYVFRWLATKFLSAEAQFRAGVNTLEPGAQSPSKSTEGEQLTLAVVAASAENSAGARASLMSTIQNQEDAPPCSLCGAIMVRSGSCYKCANCGSTSGCA